MRFTRRRCRKASCGLTGLRMTVSASGKSEKPTNKLVSSQYEMQKQPGPILNIKYRPRIEA